MKIKQNPVNFKIENTLSIRKPVSRKKTTTHYPILDLVLNVVLYISDAKKRCKKKGFESIVIGSSFIVSKFEYQQCIECRPVQLRKYLSVMSVSSILISLSETYQQMYLHVSSVTLSKKSE